MKINAPSFALVLAAICWLGSPAPSVFAVHAKSAKGPNGEGGATADISMFYDALKPDGTWYNTTQYGDVWHPSVADQKPGWRPYSNGSWAETDQGWTWVTDEPFGWAVYHYGRWTQLKDTGWVWVPDSEWAPAWVAWRTAPSLQVAEIEAPEQVSYHDADSAAASTPAPPASPAPAGSPALSGGAAPPPAEPPDAIAAADAGTPVAENYIGWAPLPPEATLEPGGDIGPSVDVSCAIDPAAYCFVDAVDFGAPDLGVVIFPVDRNYFYVQHTLNVTNIGYYGPGARSVYVGGPDFGRVRALSKQPVPALQLSRMTGSRAVANSLRDGHGSVVRGNTLQVAGPRFNSRPAGGVLGGNRPSLPKADSAKADPPAGADPAAVAGAHAAMARQEHATVSHAQAVKAVAASKAQYRTVRRNPHATLAASHTQAAKEGASGRHTASAGSGERTARSEGSRRGSSLARTNAAHPPQQGGFLSQLRQGVSRAGTQVAHGGAAVPHAAAPRAVAPAVKKKN